MTREEAHQLIAQREGRVCVRLYRRADGTVITADCPIGRRHATRPMWWSVTGFVALMASGAAVWSRPAAPANHSAPAIQTPLVDRARTWPVVGAVVNRVSPQPVMMGDIAMPPAPVAPTPPVGE